MFASAVVRKNGVLESSSRNDGEAGQPSGTWLVRFAEILASSNHPHPMRLLVFVGLLCVLGCRERATEKNGEKKDHSESASSVTAGASPPTGEELRKLLPPERVAQVTNPGGAAVYTGPTGTVAGIVRVTGDPSPPLELGTRKIPLGECFEAHTTYKSLFREGPERVLPDVLVAVTGYSGYLPPPEESILVEAKGCAFETRTVAMMLGQSLKVKNRGKEAVTPQLLGAPTLAWLVAIPGGDPIELVPHKIGMHKLIDRSHEFSFADVFVVPYRTTAVTGLDGRFEVQGVPVGSLKINALLPATGQTVEQSIEVAEGKTTEVSLVLSFDLASLKAAEARAPDPAAPSP